MPFVEAERTEVRLGRYSFTAIVSENIIFFEKCNNNWSITDESNPMHGLILERCVHLRTMFPPTIAREMKSSSVYIPPKKSSPSSRESDLQMKNIIVILANHTFVPKLNGYVRLKISRFRSYEMCVIVRVEREGVVLRFDFQIKIINILDYSIILEARR